jgi:hypothetical protein
MRDGFRHDLRAMLDDQQQVRFDALMKQIDQHQAEFVSRIKASPQDSEGAAEE